NVNGDIEYEKISNNYPDISNEIIFKSVRLQTASIPNDKFQKYRKDYLKYIYKIKIDTGRDLVQEQLNYIDDQIKVSKDIIRMIYDDKIYDKLNPKAKHFKYKKKGFLNGTGNLNFVTYIKKYVKNDSTDYIKLITDHNIPIFKSV